MKPILFLLLFLTVLFSEVSAKTELFFHIVNEKFSSNNSVLSKHVEQFLRNVWNEALLTNNKDTYGVNLIAYKQLNNAGSSILYENGLRLANPNEKNLSSRFDDTLSTIRIIRGNEWDAKTHPLLIVFHHYALDGANLINIKIEYDDHNEDHLLSFEIKEDFCNDFYNWTSRFSEDTLFDKYKKIHPFGWRIAVILNGQIISIPKLYAPLKNSCTIKGNFSIDELRRIAASSRSFS